MRRCLCNDCYGRNEGLKEQIGLIVFVQGQWREERERKELQMAVYEMAQLVTNKYSLFLLVNYFCHEHSSLR